MSDTNFQIVMSGSNFKVLIIAGALIAAIGVHEVSKTRRTMANLAVRCPEKTETLIEIAKAQKYKKESVVKSKRRKKRKKGKR